MLRHTFLLNAVRDATSAAIPYGALTVPPLAEAAGVPHTRPRLVYVRPDETGLGTMSARFQGKLALLEEKFEAPASRTPALAGGHAVLSDDDDMLSRSVRAPRAPHRPARRFCAPACSICGWATGTGTRASGHWAAFSAPGGRVRYQAIPKDRDQVYFRFDDGVVPWLAAGASSRPSFKPSGRVRQRAPAW